MAANVSCAPRWGAFFLLARAWEREAGAGVPMGTAAGQRGALRPYFWRVKKNGSHRAISTARLERIAALPPAAYRRGVLPRPSCRQVGTERSSRGRLRT